MSAYAGIDPLTRRAIRFKSTAKTEQQARIELGRLLKDASEGRRPESGAAVATLMGRVRRGRGVGRAHPADQRRIHPPHHQVRLGPMKVRKVRGPILDKLYAELKRCGDLTCTGKPFIEHRNVPVLTINPRDPRPAWQQVTATLTEAIRSGILVPGEELPSITEVSDGRASGPASSGTPWRRSPRTA